MIGDCRVVEVEKDGHTEVVGDAADARESGEPMRLDDADGGERESMALSMG